MLFHQRKVNSGLGHPSKVLFECIVAEDKVVGGFYFKEI